MLIMIIAFDMLKQSVSLGSNVIEILSETRVRSHEQFFFGKDQYCHRSNGKEHVFAFTHSKEKC